jgi:hypothetical protein
MIAPFCPPIFGYALMGWVLYFIAAMTHLTGAQRMARRLVELDRLDAEDAKGDTSATGDTNDTGAKARD